MQRSRRKSYNESFHYNYDQPLSFSNHAYNQLKQNSLHYPLKSNKQNAHHYTEDSKLNCNYHLARPPRKDSNKNKKQAYDQFTQNRKQKLINSSQNYSYQPLKNNNYSRDKKQRCYDIPSFGNTIRQCNPYDQYKRQNKKYTDYSNQKFNKKENDSIKNSKRNDNYKDQNKNNQFQYDRLSAKSWDKPIASNLRSQQLKQISKKRVVNIDKINSKIKSILDKLNEEDNLSRNNYNSQSSKKNSVQSRDFNKIYKVQQKLRASNYVKQQTPNIDKSTRIKTDFDEKDYIFNNFRNQNQYSQFSSKKSQNLYEQHSPAKYIYKNPLYLNYIQSSRNKVEESKHLNQNSLLNYRYDRSEHLLASYQPQSKQFEYNYDSHYNEKKYKDSRLSYQRQEKYFKSPLYPPIKNEQIKNDYERININRSYSHIKSRQNIESNSNSQIKRDLSQHRLPSGKNLELQIQKIQQRIQKSKKMQKELNIDQEIPEKNYNYCRKYSSKSLKSKEDVKQYCKAKLYDQINVPKQKISSQQIFIPKPFLLSRNRATKRQNCQRSQFFIQKDECLNQQDDHSDFQNKSQCRKILKLQFSPPVSTNRENNKEINLFIERIQKQVELDSQLRNAKKWFESYLMQSKWEKMQLLLKQREFNLSIEQIKNIFKIDEDQVNPFFSARQNNFSLQNLIEKYIESEQFWNQNIAGQFNRNKIIKGGFIEKNIDLNKKGIISIQDFIRFINFEGNTFFRTRDMILLFKRIDPGYQVSYENMLSIFTD